jgi:hypothetical protein
LASASSRQLPAHPQSEAERAASRSLIVFKLFTFYFFLSFGCDLGANYIVHDNYQNLTSTPRGLHPGEKGKEKRELVTQATGKFGHV